MLDENGIIHQDNWSTLRQFTAARIALGRTGISVPANELLRFKMSHAHARDAVFSRLDKTKLEKELAILQLTCISLQSQATDRHLYLQRPDLGRRLNQPSRELLDSFTNTQFDVCINIVDGLSAEAVNQHAIPFIALLQKALLGSHILLTPICIIEGGRVAIGDETGSLLNAKLSLVLIGERPGLSSPNSLGAYLTYAPKIGLTDESRNCVSNIRPEGLHYKEAAEKISFLIKEALRLRLTGVGLKDNGSSKLEFRR